MSEIINGVPIGDLPGIESVPDDSMLVVEFLGKAYHMPGAVLRQMIQDVLDSMGDSVDDVTEARLTAAIETVLASGKYNGFSPIVEVLDEEDGTSVIHIIDAFGVKKYPVEVKGARNAVQYVEQSLTDAQKAQARKNIGLDDAAGSADNVYVAGLFSAKYADIKAAYEAGKACFITYGALLCTMTVFDEEKAEFVGMLTPHIGMKGILNADGSYSFAYVHSNAVQTVAQNLTDEQKAQVRENIGIGEISNSILVELSGNPTDGYTAILDGEAVTGDELDEMAKNGSHITGVATESLVFQVSNGINGTSYTVPDGTFFTYSNAVVTGNPGFYGTGGVHSFEFRVCLQDYNFAIAYKAVADQDEKVWVSATQATHMVFRLGISQGIPAVLYGTQMLYGNSVPNMNYLYTILAESQLLNRPVFCYQVNMPFYTEDGTEMTPYSGVLFSLKINSAYQYFFEAEHEGYVYRFTVKQNEGYSCTAEPTEVYKKVQSKADGLKASNGALTLLSAGEPIGEEVSLPTGSEPLVVTLSGNDTDGYTAGKTVAEINEARNAGRDIYMVGGILTYQLCYLSSSFASFTYTRASGTAIEVISVVLMDGVAPVRFQQTIDDSYVKYTAQSLDEESKLQARTNIGALSTGDVDTVLQQAKDSGLFDGKDGQDGEDGYTPVKGKDYFDGANGKTAYAYAQDGGYTGTEAEFAAKLASDSEPLVVTLSGNDTDGYTADKTVAEIYAARTAGRDVYMVGGVVTYQLSYLNSSFAAFSYTMASRNAIEIISVIMMSGVAPTRIHQTIDDSYVKYTAQSLDEEYKLQARSNIGAVGYTAPANVAGTEQVTAKFHTSNGGSIAFGKEGPNSGTMIRLDQADGTCRLRFRASATAGAMVWEQPEQGAQLYVDLGKDGVDKRRIIFPAAAGTLALTSQIPSLSGYLPLSGGTVSGKFIATGGVDIRGAASSLPLKVRGIVGSDGNGTVAELYLQYGANKALMLGNTGAYNISADGSTYSGISAKATADANGNNIVNTYANKNVSNTFTGEQKMVHSTYAPTMNDIASGVGCSLKNARACDNQLIVAEIFAPTTAATDSTINMNAVVGEIGFYHGGSGSGGQFSGKTQLARITSAGIYEGSTLLSNKYLAKSGGTMTGALNLKNSTWNLAGDDAYFGDNDTAGSFAIKGANGTTNLKMVTHNGTTYGTLSWNGSNFAFSNALNFPGGTLTGNLTVGSAKIQTNGYVIGTWLQVTANNAASDAINKVCVQNNNGWIYTRTLDQLRNDMNAASKDEVIEAANGALIVNLNTNSNTVDKSVSEIKAALDVGRNVYMLAGQSILQLDLIVGTSMAEFSATRATSGGIVVVTVSVAGTSATVYQKSITA